MSEKRIKITLKKSPIGYSERQKKTVRGLGLKRLYHSRILRDTPAVRGMVDKVSHLVEVEEVD